MIEAATMKRIARIKLTQRDARRAYVREAEQDVRDAEQALERQRHEAHNAHAAFLALHASSPAELELLARAIVESSEKAAEAKQVLSAREQALEEGRAQRVNAEREMRGLDLARTRIRKLEEARLDKDEERLLELRTGRRV